MLPMTWRGSQFEFRQRLLAKYDHDEVERYEAWILQLTSDDETAALADIRRVFGFRTEMKVLDAGAGTGTLSQMLLQVPGLAVTALEPLPRMLEKLRSKPKLKSIETIEGFCDKKQTANYSRNRRSI